MAELIPNYADRGAALKQFSRDFRFGSLSRASYAPPTLDTTNLSPEQGPPRSRGSVGSFFVRLRGARLLSRNRFLRHRSDLPPSASDFATEIAGLPARHWQSPDPPRHLAKQPPMQMSLGQQQPVLRGVIYQPSSRLQQPLKSQTYAPANSYLQDGSHTAGSGKLILSLRLSTISGQQPLAAYR